MYDPSRSVVCDLHTRSPPSAPGRGGYLSRSRRSLQPFTPRFPTLHDSQPATPACGDTHVHGLDTKHAPSPHRPGSVASARTPCSTARRWPHTCAAINSARFPPVCSCSPAPRPRRNTRAPNRRFRDVPPPHDADDPPPRREPATGAPPRPQHPARGAQAEERRAGPRVGRRRVRGGPADGRVLRCAGESPPLSTSIHAGISAVLRLTQRPGVGGRWAVTTTYCMYLGGMRRHAGRRVGMDFLRKCTLFFLSLFSFLFAPRQRIAFRREFRT